MVSLYTLVLITCFISCHFALNSSFFLSSTIFHVPMLLKIFASFQLNVMNLKTKNVLFQLKPADKLGTYNKRPLNSTLCKERFHM